MMNAASSPPRKRFAWAGILCLIVPIAAVLLLASGVALIGSRELAHARAELRSRGETLSLIALAPPQIPDERNFFADPIWQELVEQVDGVLPSSPAAKRHELDILNTPIPEPELSSLQRHFPKFTEFTHGSDRLALSREATRKLNRSTDPPERVAAATFVLAVLEPLRPVTHRIDELLHRPDARFPIRYDRHILARLPHFQPLLSLGRVFSDRAGAELELRQTGPALEDTLATLKLANTLQSEPLLISVLVRQNLIGRALSTTAAGIRSHAWRESDLARLEAALEPIDLLANTARALRGERAAFNALMDALRANSFRDPEDARMLLASRAPGETPGLRDTLVQLQFATTGGMDQAFYLRTLQPVITFLDTGSARGISPKAAPELPEEPMSWTAGLFHRWSWLALPAIFTQLPRTAAAQDEVLQTRIAIALERFRLKSHTYPATLSELVPAFIAAIPPDVIAGEAFRYRRENADAFRLWSVGWDQIDGGGHPAERRLDYENGDWVWAVAPGSKP